MTDDAGSWLERRGIKRTAVAKDQHLALIDRHHALIRRTYRLLKSDAEDEGIQVGKDDILAESTSAKNLCTEYSGWSPMQAITGRNHDYSRIDLADDTTESDNIFTSTRIRALALK